jgi:phage terminase large subunit
MSEDEIKLYLNDPFREMFNETARYYYNIGGRYSGKTHDSIQAVLYRLLYVEGSRACMMRKVYGSIKDTLFSDTMHILNHANVKYRKTVSPLSISFQNGSDIIFKGADDPEKLKGLSSVDIMLIDEANEFTEQDFETVDQSIRGKRQENSIYLCHNPVPKVPGSQYWFEKQFKVLDNTGHHNLYYDEKLGSNVCTMRTTYLNNAKCPEHVKRRLEGYKETNPALYKLWALGQYAEMKGVILSNWDVVLNVPEGVEELGNGLDFGFSEDPAACVKVWANSSDIWVKGLLYSTGLTNDELYDKLVLAGVDAYDVIIADSAEPKSIEDLYKRGLLRIEGVKKHKNYKAEMANILMGYKIHLIDGDTDLQREFSTWCWDEDKTGKLLPRPKDGNDHYMDALIMLCSEKLGNGSSVVY